MTSRPATCTSTSTPTATRAAKSAASCSRNLKLLALVLALGAAWPVAAQYPERAIRFIVPQAAGSATDNISRIVAPELAKQLGQSVVVDNRPGGALTIGIDAVAKAPPDGYTLGMGPVGALAITRHMVAKLPYDIERDLQPVAIVTTGYMLLAISPKFPVESVRELIDYAKKNPGKLSNASSSNGSPGHVSGELFKSMTGTDIVHIPYKGGAPAIADLIAGNVQLMFESTNSIAPHVKNGRVRALAVTGAKRSTSLPEVPTLAEAGVPGYEVNTWSGVIAPAGLPRAVLGRLNAAVNAAIATPQAKARLAELGNEGGGGTPEDFAELIRRDSAKWAEVVRRSGAKID
jgi:tripartite-type tricarboxylate transporter receptor subunit TctC